MKAKHTSKSVISLILALVMAVSMITVGIVTASSAEVDAAASGSSVIEVWFTRPTSWGNTPNVHYWGGASASDWPGQAMTYKYTNDYSQSVYYTTIPGDSTSIIFNNGNGSYQTGNITLPGNAVVAYYVSGNDTSNTANVTQWEKAPDSLLNPTEASETPTAPPVTGDKIRLAVADDTTDRWLGNDDAQFKVVINGAATSMTRSVDVASGLKVWYADVAQISSGTSIKFQRCSAINTNTVWNEFSTSYVAGSPLYKVGDNDTITSASMLEIPDGTATNFGYGIWVDAKGNGDTKDFVKIYASDFVKDTTYHLYLPAYTDWAQLKVYTNFPTLTINGTAVTKGQVNTLNLSTAGIERTVNISFKRNAAGSTHSGSLHIMRSGAASALLMTTKIDLYTGLTAAYAANEDNSANYEGVAAYKSTVSTKGDYLCYDKNGTLLNPLDKETGKTLTTLKKLKARGNSTFEASMRLYGKTAYNITLNDKAQLIEDCEASKKYSLLANNADESLMRNVTVYGIADEIGMPYTPNTRLIDLFDNGEYLGAYVLTEKVEYGKNTLIPDAKSLDKFNEDVLAAGKGIDYDGLKQREATYTAKSGTVYTYQYSYNPSGEAYEFDGSTVTVDDKTYTLNESTMKKYDFLLEHELATRYKPEATWFVSGRTKQAVVPKYPEFATQKEVQWMIEQYDALETAVQADNYTTMSELADIESFASVYLIQELTMNLDACATSYNILGGASYPKLLAAPLWDYDWAAGMYNGKKLTVGGEIDVADTSKVFVKDKSVKIDDSDGRTQSIYNLQAKMAHNSQFWTECKKVWTNKFVPVLQNYLGDGNTLLGETLPEFRTAAAMNESRWNVLHKMNSNPEEYWGTRSTTQYKKGSNNFAVGGNKCTGSSFNYDNTVYYLNDWLTKRRDYMSSGMGLYDATLIVPETEPPTDAPTDPPTDAPTDPPTDAPTDAPKYKIGDVDGDGSVTIVDATRIQRICANYPYSDEVIARAAIIAPESGPSILDATYIQLYKAGYTSVTSKYHIGEYPED